jgi:hypothetical protein
MMRATAYFLRDEERSTQQKKKKKSERREVSQNEERKEGRGKGQKEGERLYYHLTQLVNFAFNFSLYAVRAFH